MDKLEMAKALMACWPGSYIYRNGEFIAHERSNTYLIFENCETMEDLQCKVLEWFSRAAHKTLPYTTEKSNSKFHQFMLDGINRFLSTTFDFDDMDLIYTYLGNAVHHDLTVKFVRSGYDMSLLYERAGKDRLRTEYTPQDFDKLCREMSDLRMALGLDTYDDLRQMIKDHRVTILPAPSKKGDKRPSCFYTYPCGIWCPGMSAEDGDEPTERCKNCWHCERGYAAEEGNR